MPEIKTLLVILSEIKYSKKMHRMYSDGGGRKLVRTGMRNKLFILHDLTYNLSPFYIQSLCKEKYKIYGSRHHPSCIV